MEKFSSRICLWLQKGKVIQNVWTYDLDFLALENCPGADAMLIVAFGDAQEVEQIDYFTKVGEVSLQIPKTERTRMIHPSLWFIPPLQLQDTNAISLAKLEAKKK